MNRTDFNVFLSIFFSISLIVIPLQVFGNLLVRDTTLKTIVAYGNSIVFIIGLSLLIMTIIYHCLRQNDRDHYIIVQGLLDKVRIFLLFCGLILFVAAALGESYNVFGYVVIFILMTTSPYSHYFKIVDKQVVYCSDMSFTEFRITGYQEIGVSAIQVFLDNGTKKTISFNKKEKNTLELLKNKLGQSLEAPH
jgi:hypothetical protein